MKKTIVTFLTLLFVYQTYSQEIVEYIVESNRNGFDITYTNDGGNTEQKKLILINGKLHLIETLVHSFLY